MKNFDKIGKIEILGITAPESCKVDWMHGVLFPTESRRINVSYKPVSTGQITDQLTFRYTFNGIEYTTKVDMSCFVSDPAAQLAFEKSKKVQETEQAEADVSKSAKRAVWTSISGNSIAFEYYENGVMSPDNPSGFPLLKKKTYIIGSIAIYVQIFKYDSMQRVVLESCIEPETPTV